jgi:hypothetical protein
MILFGSDTTASALVGVYVCSSRRQTTLYEIILLVVHIHPSDAVCAGECMLLSRNLFPPVVAGHVVTPSEACQRIPPCTLVMYLKLFGWSDTPREH